MYATHRLHIWVYLPAAQGALFPPRSKRPAAKVTSLHKLNSCIVRVGVKRVNQTQARVALYFLVEFKPEEHRLTSADEVGDVGQVWYPLLRRLLIYEGLF